MVASTDRSSNGVTGIKPSALVVIEGDDTAACADVDVVIGRAIEEESDFWMPLAIAGIDKVGFLRKQHRAAAPACTAGARRRAWALLSLEKPCQTGVVVTGAVSRS